MVCRENFDFVLVCRGSKSLGNTVLRERNHIFYTMSPPLLIDKQQH
jgi:hypothetical protein